VPSLEKKITVIKTSFFILSEKESLQLLNLNL